MKHIAKKFMVGVCIFFISVRPGFADELHLKSGNSIRGNIVEETENSVKFRVEGSVTEVLYYKTLIETVVRENVKIETTGLDSILAEAIKLIDRVNKSEVASATDDPNVLADNVSWWKYSGREDGLKYDKYITIEEIGTEDVEVSGVLFKAALKMLRTEVEMFSPANYEIAQCTVWAVSGDKNVKEDCRHFEYSDSGKLLEIVQCYGWLLPEIGEIKENCETLSNAVPNNEAQIQGQGDFEMLLHAKVKGQRYIGKDGK